MTDPELLMEFRNAIEGGQPYGKIGEEILRRMARSRRKKKAPKRTGRTPRGRQKETK